MKVTLRNEQDETVHVFEHPEYVDHQVTFILKGQAYAFLHHSYVDGARTAIYRARRTILIDGGSSV